MKSFNMEQARELKLDLTVSAYDTIKIINALECRAIELDDMSLFDRADVYKELTARIREQVRQALWS